MSSENQNTWPQWCIDMHNEYYIFHGQNVPSMPPFPNPNIQQPVMNPVWFNWQMPCSFPHDRLVFYNSLIKNPKLTFNYIKILGTSLKLNLEI